MVVALLAASRAISVIAGTVLMVRVSFAHIFDSTHWNPLVAFVAELKDINDGQDMKCTQKNLP